MAPIHSEDRDRTALLERLNSEAAVSVDGANDYSVRSWLTSAKKCLDQVTPIRPFFNANLLGRRGYA
jgi:hypothetical protein